MENNMNIFEDYPDVVNVKQMQKMLGIGRSLAYNLLKNNKIKSLRIGRLYKIPKVNIVKYIYEL